MDDPVMRAMMLQMVNAANSIAGDLKRIADAIEIVKAAEEERWTPTNYVEGE